jgi:hypothetical protein
MLGSLDTRQQFSGTWSECGLNHIIGAPLFVALLQADLLPEIAILFESSLGACWLVTMPNRFHLVQ